MRVIVHARSGIGNPHELQHLHGPVKSLFLRNALVLEHHFHDLHTDREHRIQRSHRLLEDHADLFAADVADLVPGELQQIPPFIKDGAAGNFAWRIRYEPQNAERGHALAGSGLANKTKNLAGINIEVDAIDGLGRSGFGPENRLETANL